MSWVHINKYIDKHCDLLKDLANGRFFENRMGWGVDIQTDIERICLGADWLKTLKGLLTSMEFLISFIALQIGKWRFLIFLSLPTTVYFFTRLKQFIVSKLCYLLLSTLLASQPGDMGLSFHTSQRRVPGLPFHCWTC